MTKEEFERKSRRIISDEDFRIINTVYQYHPFFKSAGKKKIVEWYKIAGIEWIRRLYSTALSFKRKHNKGSLVKTQGGLLW